MKSPEWAGELWPLEEAEDGLELASADAALLAVANSLGLYVLDTATGERSSGVDQLS
ncbi:hypothetical protein OG533_39030 [Streptomyces sp. NBC_01186]|uniref:hypothetical protein n=1 Tax=Streptomyces sp. NBC_01186 TaxID=2903765 RepID=UPI002E15FB7B|nr:hypothetical protein OG533_39030 [Streptomyces sp. NBC_01186]